MSARRRSQYAICLLLVLLTGAPVHGPHLARNFHRHHWEDWRFFRHSRTQIHSLSDCFTKPSVWPGLYRPLSTNCYYLIVGTLSGRRVEAYHAMNAAVHVVNALLLFSVARRLLPWPWSLVPALLLASRLAHVGVILPTSGFQALCSVLLALAALNMHLEGREGSRGTAAAGPALFALALLCYEPVVALPAIVSAYALLFDRGGGGRRYAAWWLVALAWAVLFATVFRGVSGHQPTGFSYDFSGRIVTRYASYLLSFLNVLVYPMDSTDMVMRIPLLAGRALVLAPLWLLAAFTITVLAITPRLGEGRAAAALRTMAFGQAWFVAGVAPFVLFEDRMFLRYGYFAHAGLALSLGGFATLVAQRPWLLLRARLASNRTIRAASAAAAVPRPKPGRP